MRQQGLIQDKLRYYLAYRLGCLPYEFLEGLAVHLSYPSMHNSISLAFQWVIEESRAAIHNLHHIVEDNQLASEVEDAITARWTYLNQRYKLRAKPEDTPEGTSLPREELLSFVNLHPDEAWLAFSDTITRFWQQMPEDFRVFAELGKLVAEIVTFQKSSVGRVMEESIRQAKDRFTTPSDLRSFEPVPDSRLAQFVSAATTVSMMLSELSLRYPIMHGLTIDLSPDRHNRLGQPNRYHVWVQSTTRSLHTQIADRLGPNSEFKYDKPVFVTATAASTIGDALGVDECTLPNISKWARKRWFPSHQPGQDNRREAEKKRSSRDIRD